MQMRNIYLKQEKYIIIILHLNIFLSHKNFFKKHILTTKLHRAKSLLLMTLKLLIALENMFSSTLSLKNFPKWSSFF